MALFYIFAIILIISALAVVCLENPMHSALCLILNLFCVAVFFAMLEAHFLAVVQIIVYAGAIMVLVLMVLMLLNLKVENPRKTSLAYVILSAVLALVLFGLLSSLFEVGFAGMPMHALSGTVKQIGKLLYTKYLFTFEIASILIMAAITGAVMLAKRKYKS